MRASFKLHHKEMMARELLRSKIMFATLPKKMLDADGPLHRDVMLLNILES